MLALHGHEARWGKADEVAFEMGHVDDFCAYFAQRGWAVLQPATMQHHLQHERWTLQGQWTWDAIVALDYAATVAQVDMSRCVACGLSTGGYLAMNVLALDQRVRAGVVGCILSTWNHYGRYRMPPHCDCGIVTQLGGRLEQCDWAAPDRFFKEVSLCPTPTKRWSHNCVSVTSAMFSRYRTVCALSPVVGRAIPHTILADYIGQVVHLFARLHR